LSEPTDPKPDVSFYRPTFSRLLVEPDDPSELVTPSGLVAPDVARRKRPTSGHIVAAGWDCGPEYRVGRRVVFGPFAGTQIKLRSRAHLMMDRSEVLALTDGEEDEEDPLGVSWKEHLRPPPGQYLIERVEMPVYQGQILIPDHLREDVRASEALVVRAPERSVSCAFSGCPLSAVRHAAVCEDCGCEEVHFCPECDDWKSLPVDRFPAGTRVFLMGTVSRFIALGRREEIKLWVCHPTDFAAILAEDPGEVLAAEELHHLRARGELAAMADRTGNFEEGDPRARR
jgi:chaperonin GroES